MFEYCVGHEYFKQNVKSDQHGFKITKISITTRVGGQCYRFYQKEKEAIEEGIQYQL